MPYLIGIFVFVAKYFLLTWGLSFKYEFIFAMSFLSSLIAICTALIIQTLKEPR